MEWAHDVMKMMKYFLVLLITKRILNKHLLKANIWRSAVSNQLVTEVFKEAARESCSPLLNTSTTQDNQWIAVLLTIKKGKIDVSQL